MNKIKKVLEKFWLILANVRVSYLGWLYYIHLKVRYLHDATYQKSKVYKKYSDNPMTQKIHRVATYAFVTSFVVFTLVQAIFPNFFNLTHPNTALAGQSSVTWTTTGDFAYNKSSPDLCEEVQNSQVKISGTAYTDPTCIASDVDGTITLPFENVSLTDIISVSAGNTHALALKNDGTVWTWGRNNLGQLGNNTLVNSPTPVQVLGLDGQTPLSSIVEISAGMDHSMALDTNGLVFAWGSNSSGRLGDGTTTNRSLPIQVRGVGGQGFLASIEKISAGEIHSMALDSNGSVFAWGSNNLGRLGDGTATDRSLPIQVKGVGGQGFLLGVNAISAGESSFAIVSSSVFSWGPNNYGVLGDGTNTNRSTPVQVKDVEGSGYLSNVVSISASKRALFSHALALKADGTVFGWGYNYLGQLGDGTTEHRNAPTQVIGENGLGYLQNIASISVGNMTSHAVTNIGSVYSWGASGGAGRLGDGTNNNSYFPVLVKGVDEQGYLTNASGPSGGHAFSSVISGGRVYSWGSNTYGQLGNASYINSFTPVIAGFGDIYPNYGTLSNLKIDAGAGKSASWSTISWNGTEPSGTNVKFRTRGADAEGDLASATWSAYLEPTPGALADLVTASSKWLEIELTLESTDGANTPTLNDFTVTYDTIEAPAITPKKTDDSFLNEQDSTLWTNESSVKVEANEITCESCGTSDGRYIEAQASTDGTNFTNPITAQGSVQAAGSPSMATISGLSTGNTYYLRARSLDAQGRVSGWTVFDKTVTLDQTPPTGLVTINSGAQYATSNLVTLNLTAADTGGSGLSNNVRLSNNGTAWEDWTRTVTWTGPDVSGNYTATVTGWDITNATYGGTTGDGTKNVYVQYRDNAGNVSGFFHTTEAQFSGTLGAGVSKAGGDLKLISGKAEAGSQTLRATSDDVPVVANFPVGAKYVRFSDKQWSGSDSDGGSVRIQVYNNGIWTTVHEDICDFGCQEAVPTQWFDATGAQLVNDTWSISWYEVKATFGKDGFPASGAYTSQSMPNSGLITSINWSDKTTSPNGGSVTMKVRGSENSDMSAATDWSIDIQKGGTILDNIKNKPYIQYQLTLNSGDNQTTTPVVYDVSLEMASGDSITLDTTPPANVANLRAYDSSLKSVEYTATSWKNDANPYFEWDGGVKPADFAKYKYCLDTVAANCIPTIETATTKYAPTLSADGRYLFKVESYDAAGNKSVASTNFDYYGYDATVPGLPQSFTATGFTDTIDLAWSYANDTGSPLSEYLIERIAWTTYDPNNPTLGWTTANSSYRGKTFAHPTISNILSVSDTALDDNGNQWKINQGRKYAFRISAKDTVNTSFGTLSGVISGLTQDSSFDALVQNVNVSPCDGTNNCSTKNDIPHKGYENKVTWSPAVDSGVGTSHYLVYRSTQKLTSLNYNDTNVRASYKIAGVLPFVSGQNPVFYDNDANNQAVTTFYDASGTAFTLSSEIQALTTKATSSDLLNDYVRYYYRVVGVDANNNRSVLFPEAPTAEGEYDVMISYQNGNTGTDAERTPDVTAPAIPANLTLTPLGMDGVNAEPNNQAVDITWSTSADNRTVGRIPEGSGSGVQKYELWQAIGTSNGPTEDFSKVYEGSASGFSQKGLAEDSYYYYQVKAIDHAANDSGLGSQLGALTKNSQVPTTPTATYVMSKKGDSNSDPEVGIKLTTSFIGSRIKGTGNYISGYRVYRATTNLATRAEWTALTPVFSVDNLNIPADTQDPGDTSCPSYTLAGNTYSSGIRCFTDTVSTDATNYYYRVEAFGWNQSNESVEVSPSLSAVTVGTLNAGWDTTPDATAPPQPSDVKVKDIHGNDSMVRNIVTWMVIPASQRNGVPDFRRYEIWRYETLLGIVTATKIAEKTDISDNYHVDGITLATANTDYSYYVISVDNAGTEYKYPNGTIINPFFDNISTHQSPVSINPGTVKPTVEPSSIEVAEIGVSSVTIIWDTDQLTDSGVEYQKKNSNNVISAGKDRTNPVINHSVNLMALEKNTEYQYRIISRNSLGNIDEIAASTWREFKTKDFSINNVRVESKDITTTTAKVRWETSITSDSNVEYKPEGSSAKSQTKGDVSLVTEHVVTLEALRPATSYTYKVRSVTGDRYIDESNFLTFSTNAFDTSQFTITPSASDIAQENITATSAKIVWNTAIATTSCVQYDVSSKGNQGGYAQSSCDDKLNTVHVIELRNLTPGTTYYYRVTGKDSANNEYISREYSFTAVLQPEIRNIKINVNSPYSAIISFETNVDTDAVISYGTGGQLSLKAGHTDFLRGHAIEVKDLEDATPYNFFVEVKDRSNNVAKSAENRFQTPIDTTGPTIRQVKIDQLPMGEGDDSASVIISWTTDKPATTKVEYSEGLIGGKFDRATVEDKSLNTSHTVIIKGLEPSTTYKFRIASKNKRGNLSYSQESTFVTPTKERSVWQLIVKSLEETFSWVKNVRDILKRK